MRKVIYIVLTLIVAVSANIVFAQDINFGVAKINPASPFYFLKSVREILELKFAATTHVKALRQLEFATRRIREVNSLIKTSHQDLIEPTLDRYLFSLEEVTHIFNLRDKMMVEQVSVETSQHMAVLQTIYSQVSEPRAKMAIRATINRLSKFDQEIISKLNLLQLSPDQRIINSKLAGCNFLSKEASNSALNEIERIVISERAQKCLNPKL